MWLVKLLKETCLMCGIWARDSGAETADEFRICFLNFLFSKKEFLRNESIADCSSQSSYSSGHLGSKVTNDYQSEQKSL